MYISLISRLSIDYQIRGTPTKTLFRWLLSIWPVCYVGCGILYATLLYGLIFLHSQLSVTILC